MPTGSGCRLIPLLSPEADAPLPSGSSGLSQHPLGLTLCPPHCSHRQSTGDSSCSGKPCHPPPPPSWLPRRVQSTVGVAVGTSQTSALSCSERLFLPGLELGRAVAQESPQIYTTSAVWRVQRKNGTLFPSSEQDCSSGTCSYCAAPLHQAQVPNTAGLGMQQTLPDFCSSSKGRAAQQELGVHQGWKEPSFSSTKQPPLHTTGPSVGYTRGLKG